MKRIEELKNNLSLHLFDFLSDKIDLFGYLRNANSLFRKHGIIKKDVGCDGIVIFIHFYLVNDWDVLFRKYLNEIVRSGIYESALEIMVCANFFDSNDLELLKQEIHNYDKVKLFYFRNSNDLPAVIWNEPLKQIGVNLGEGESILKMIEHAKKTDHNYYYLFLHSKGVTKPDDKKRRQIQYFYNIGLDPDAPPSAIRDFITNEILKRMVVDWKDKIKMLDRFNFYYFSWNLFWARGDFLKKFDFDQFNEKAQFPRLYTMNNRHWSAIFPINLYGALYNKKIIGMRYLTDIYL